MCGISGCITDVLENEPPKLLQQVVASQKMRGPDATGFLRENFGDRQIWLAHNRLSIIDLSSAADQPMVSEDDRFSIVFNGAIYNYLELKSKLQGLGHRFSTSSDTEVLLRALVEWGPSALPKLHGMFAFAFLDRDRGRLMLARDRFGVKPLYYTQGKSSLWFASTPQVIATASEQTCDLEYVGRGIRLKYYEDEGQISPFGGVKSLPPGTFMLVEENSKSLEPRSYYDLALESGALIERFDHASDEEIQGIARETLSMATEVRLRADVQIGISLSSGVDSTSITALCAEMGSHLHGFCFGDLRDPTSEASLVSELAKRYGQQVTYVPQSSGQEAVSLFWKTFRAQSAPFPHTSQMAQFAVFEAAHDHGVKVMLGGQGGDEAFMGYRKYFLYQLRHLSESFSPGGVAAVASNILHVLPSIASRANLFWRERKRYSSENGEGLGSSLSLPGLEASSLPGVGLGSDPRFRQIADIRTFSLPSLLRYEDRSSMGNSIESRLPFLDHRVIELGVALPIHAKLRRGFGKYALRRAMGGSVPDAILFNRDKRGFDTRHADWIHSGLGATIRSAASIHKKAVAQLLGDKEIDLFFSDAELASKPTRFAEATSLLWLADPTLESYPH